MAKPVQSKTFGSVLREARLAKGWSQTEAGKAIGCHFSTICNYEVDSQVPRKDRLRKICEVFNLNFVEMFHLVHGLTE